MAGAKRVAELLRLLLLLLLRLLLLLFVLCLCCVLLLLCPCFYFVLRISFGTCGRELGNGRGCGMGPSFVAPPLSLGLQLADQRHRGVQWM
jgi:hypothetical protein